MGYAVYDDRNHRNRFAGYGVPAICDHPDCSKKIDRGLYYACGEGNFLEYCGLHFCDSHLESARVHGDPDDPEEEEGDYLWLCERCAVDDPPFEPKPDLPEWKEHQLSDESWEQWRNENPELVAQYRAELGS